jgi:hypothetical protein
MDGSGVDNHQWTDEKSSTARNCVELYFHLFLQDMAGNAEEVVDNNFGKTR